MQRGPYNGEGRVLNDRLREAVEEAMKRGVTLSHICRVIARDMDPRWVRERYGSPGGNADTSRLRRTLGMNTTSRGHYNRTTSIEFARVVCRAIEVEYGDLGLDQDLKRCACGEEIVLDATECGWCQEERELVVAA